MARKGKVAKAPDGLYTAKDAIKKLNMPPATFHHYVKVGKIKKIIPYGRREGYYEKAYIDKMAEASQLFVIQYAEDSAVFSRATRDDLQGIYDVMVSLWGTLNVTPIDTRLSWHEANSEIDYVVKQEGIVTGYVTIKPLKHEIIEGIMTGEIKAREIQPSDIFPFAPGMPLECLVGTAVRAGVYKPERFGMRLLAGAITTFREFASRGITVKKLYAQSETPDGIKLCRGLGFEDISTRPGRTPKQFMLDFETSDSPFVQEYQKILEEHKK